MGKRDRLYSPEFRAEAVRLVQASDEDHLVSKISKDLDVPTETLRKRVNQTEINSGQREGLTTEEREELHTRPDVSRVEPRGFEPLSSLSYGWTLTWFTVVLWHFTSTYPTISIRGLLNHVADRVVLCSTNSTW
jgi:transposase-like protein